MSWEPDELLMDERWLAVHVAGKGLVVFSAWSLAGIVNVLKHARSSFPGVPLHAVMGGLHLAGVNEEIIRQTFEAMREFKLAAIAAGHCTGWRAMSALAVTFGNEVVAPTAVGNRYTFEGNSASHCDWWSQAESNRRPLECHSSALPTELWPQS